jgi:protein TonB
MLFKSPDMKVYALNKKNYISISMDSVSLKTKSTKKKSQIKPVEKASQEITKDVDVNDLFSDVWTKKITKTKPKAKNNRRIDAIQKKIKTTEQNSVESLSQKLESLDSKKNDDENSAESSANEVNEYLAKIQAIVYKYFHVPENSQGHSVKAVIELNALGKVIDFRILNYSTNDALNTEVDKIKNRLSNIVFPINPEHKTSRTIVILKSKE